MMTFDFDFCSDSQKVLIYLHLLYHPVKQLVKCLREIILKSVFPKLTHDQSTSTHIEIITFVFALLFMESFLTIF